MRAPQRYIGLMSGTSLDGIDAVLAEFSDPPRQIHACCLPLDASLRVELLALNTPGANELHRAALAANAFTQRAADAVLQLLREAECAPSEIAAIGSHGQTVRHRPDLGYTLQLDNPALLAELTGISVIADFRRRDIAATGQGAPLVPAFHAALFRHPALHRVIVNIGGIANLTDLPPQGVVTGFDCGPGNLLLDGWASRHLGKPYDANGDWAASGRVLPQLLESFLAEPFFAAPPPKSTGRDHFNADWMTRFLTADFAPADVQATLLELTASGIANALRTHCKDVAEIYLCGGGAHNGALFRRLQNHLPHLALRRTDELGIGVDWVEAFAFAWLAKQTLAGQPGNLPEVTGARGPRILGGIFPA